MNRNFTLFHSFVPSLRQLWKSQLKMFVKWLFFSLRPNLKNKKILKFKQKHTLKLHFIYKIEYQSIMASIYLNNLFDRWVSSVLIKRCGRCTVVQQYIYDIMKVYGHVEHCALNIELNSWKTWYIDNFHMVLVASLSWALFALHIQCTI